MDLKKKVSDFLFGTKEEQEVNKRTQEFEDKIYVRELEKEKLKQAVAKAKKRAKEKVKKGSGFTGLRDYAEDFHDNYYGDSKK